MPQLWQGRASKAVDSRVNDFNSSIRFDARMIEQDIQGSLVHSTMLGRQGIITQQDVDDIHKGLHSILDDLHSGALEIDPNAEDVHTFVEQTLTARIGDAGKRLHTGRSRNDQVALDIRLTLRDYSHTLQAYIVELIKVICRKASENTTAVMPGYTHLQRAQPITFGHALMAYASMLLRDLQRFEDATARMDAQCPLGSGALAGTTYPLDRQFTAEKLGFAAPCANSLDGVSDRDFCIELANAISICMMHLSRLSEEIILWCSWEFKFIELDDAFTTGSSIMPQKKNPDVTELIRGKTGRVYGDLNTLLVMMKGIPLAYNKDMQEDKEAVFDAVGERKSCLCLSNLGNVTLPGDMPKYVERMDFIIGVQARAPHNCGIITYNGTMYINISSCSARKEGLQGAEVVSYKYYGDAVKVTALTDTGYYKLDDDTYVHGDYLSESKPAETTTVTTTAKPISTPKQSNNTDTSSNITDQPVNCTAEEAEVFRLVNEYRAQYGIAPVKWDQNAYKAAKIRCDEITTNFSHKRNGGQRFYTVYNEIIHDRLYNYGENIASGQSTAQDVLNSWMNSELHRKNILDPDFDNLAVAFGIYNDSYKYYWVQEFTTY